MDSKVEIPEGASDNEILTLKIKAKYDIAGASARYMFDLETSKVISDIDGHMKRIPDSAKFFHGEVGEQSKDAINHLRSEFNGKKEFLSLYVVEQIFWRHEYNVL